MKLARVYDVNGLQIRHGVPVTRYDLRSRLYLGVPAITCPPEYGNGFDALDRLLIPVKGIPFTEERSIYYATVVETPVPHLEHRVAFPEGLCASPDVTEGAILRICGSKLEGDVEILGEVPYYDLVMWVLFLPVDTVLQVYIREKMMSYFWYGEALHCVEAEDFFLHTIFESFKSSDDEEEES